MLAIKMFEYSECKHGVEGNGTEFLQIPLSGPSVQNSDFSEFKEQAVKQAKFTPPEPASSEASPGVMVFLNADKKDESHAEEVAGLMNRHAVDCVLPLWEDDASSDMEYFILNSDGVIVIYGNVAAAWVRKQLVYCRNLIFRREQPLKALAVYEGPPGEKPKFNLKIPGLEIINCRDCLDEKKFGPFLSALGKGGLS